MKVAILLATHNGLRWLPEQVDSILAQRGVELRLFISDDASTDGTLPWLQALAGRDTRVVLLPATGPYGSAAQNFYHLLRNADWHDADGVAFADQDDLWHPDKLARAAALLRAQSAAAVSSNVTAFWPDGRRALVHKAQPQRAWDHLFEAAGPGCTYLLTADFAQAARAQLAQWAMAHTPPPAHHDWFCYALCRARGEHWVIDPAPSMDYRQHGNNEVGVNSGMGAARGRLRKMRSGWYRTQVLGMLRMARALNPGDSDLALLEQRLQRGSWVDRLALALRTGQLRRRWRDRLALAAFFLGGLFWRGWA